MDKVSFKGFSNRVFVYNPRTALPHTGDSVVAISIRNLGTGLKATNTRVLQEGANSCQTFKVVSFLKRGIETARLFITQTKPGLGSESVMMSILTPDKNDAAVKSLDTNVLSPFVQAMKNNGIGTGLSVNHFKGLNVESQREYEKMATTYNDSFIDASTTNL